MKKGYRIVFVALFLIVIIAVNTQTFAVDFQFPYYLLDSHNTESECWIGIDELGDFPTKVDPKTYLVGFPPGIDESAVTLRIDSWVELLFRGIIVDGPGDDIFISEMDPVGEKAIIFLTDGIDQEYLLGLAEVPNTNGQGPTIIGFDIAGILLPFEPRAVRVVGIDLRGGSPGFDLSYVKARISQGNSEFARYPYPPDNAKDVPIDAVLEWIHGFNAAQHAVFFGTDISDVYPDAEMVQNPTQPQDLTYFDPNILEMGKTYYWRVDQRNETDANSPWVGNPWSFSTETHLVLEDFESYEDIDELKETWFLNEIVHIGLSKDPDIHHLCLKAMELNYSYSDYMTTEITKDFNTPQNWEKAGVKTLELSFHGSSSNDTGCTMYVKLSDGIIDVNIPYNYDINDISEENWNLWKINLETSILLNKNDQQIDLSKIKYFTIGFKQNPYHPVKGGWGTIYFDNIILYPSRCLNENRPAADFNGDCIVDFEDYSELACNWLKSGYNIYQVQEPNEPVFWYEFENNVIDTIGNAHGEINGSPDFNSGVFGKAISFDGYLDSVDVYPVSHIFSQITKGVTVAFWQKGQDSPYERDTLFCTEYIYNSEDPAISINLGCWTEPGIYNWDCGSALSFDRRLTGKHKYKEEWANQWNHWAFTKDITNGRMQVFLNGALLNSIDNSSTDIEPFDKFTIGSGWYGGYDGLMDDLRIYDYELSLPEIAYIATNGTGIFDLPLMTPADLYKDNIIDYKDLTILTNNWLHNFMYP